MNRESLKSLISTISDIMIIIVCDAVIILGVTLAFNHLSKNKSNASCKLDYYNELELQYWSVKNELVKEVQQYIDNTAPTLDLSGIVVVNACLEKDIDIKFVLAQGLIESAFGTKGMASKTNSVWNVYAYDGAGYQDISNKGKYDHPDHSVRPYLELLGSRYLVGKSEHDLMDNFVDINDNRYASNKQYEVELKLKYNQIKDSTKIDELSQQLNKCKLRLNR